MAWTRVCASSDLGASEARAFPIERVVIALYNVDGQFFATDDTCSHEEESLSEGFLEDHLIECPKHGSQFDLRTGAVLSLPAVFPVRTYPTKVVDGDVFVDL